MENNIDKDIEQIKSSLKELETERDDIQLLCIKSELELSISNVLSELKETKETLKCTQNSWYNTSSELETYKKIAEKIAEKFTEFGYYDDTCMVSGLVKCAKCNDFDLCKQCIIDWARNEVEK